MGLMDCGVRQTGKKVLQDLGCSLTEMTKAGEQTLRKIETKITGMSDMV